MARHRAPRRRVISAAAQGSPGRTSTGACPERVKWAAQVGAGSPTAATPLLWRLRRFCDDYAAFVTTTPLL